MKKNKPTPTEKSTLQEVTGPPVKESTTAAKPKGAPAKSLSKEDPAKLQPAAPNPATSPPAPAPEKAAEAPKPKVKKPKCYQCRKGQATVLQAIQNGVVLPNTTPEYVFCSKNCACNWALLHVDVPFLKHWCKKENKWIEVSKDGCPHCREA